MNLKRYVQKDLVRASGWLKDHAGDVPTMTSAEIADALKRDEGIEVGTDKVREWCDDLGLGWNRQDSCLSALARRVRTLEDERERDRTRLKALEDLVGAKHETN